jgi:hypothetical protein
MIARITVSLMAMACSMRCTSSSSSRSRGLGAGCRRRLDARLRTRLCILALFCSLVSSSLVSFAAGFPLRCWLPHRRSVHADPCTGLALPSSGLLMNYTR